MTPRLRSSLPARLLLADLGFVPWSPGIFNPDLLTSPRAVPDPLGRRARASLRPGLAGPSQGTAAGRVWRASVCSFGLALVFVFGRKVIGWAGQGCATPVSRTCKENEHVVSCFLSLTYTLCWGQRGRSHRGLLPLSFHPQGTLTTSPTCTLWRSPCVLPHTPAAPTCCPMEMRPHGQPAPHKP